MQVMGTSIFSNSAEEAVLELSTITRVAFSLPYNQLFPTMISKESSLELEAFIIAFLLPCAFIELVK